MKKLNVLFLTSWYPDKIKPLSGNFIEKHALSVSKLCNVYVIHVRAVNQKEKFILVENSNKGIIELRAYYKKYNSKLPVFSFLIKIFDKVNAYKKTYKHLKQTIENIDIVHLNVFLPAGVFAKFLFKKYKIPYIITEHWTKFLSISEKSFSFTEKLMIKSINKNASVICPVSNNLAEEMKKFRLKNKYIVVPNVVNTKIFFCRNEKKSHPKIRFLHVSHLDDKHKNIKGILTVFQKLSSIRQDFFLTVSGSRNIENAKKYAKKISFPENMIRFEGRKSEEEVAETMRNNDVFVMFSNYENLPVVISEALVTGIPVIATDVGGVSEMINDNNGLLVKAGDETLFLERIIYLMDNISEYDNSVISEEAKKIYCYDTVGAKFQTIYQNVLKETI